MDDISNAGEPVSQDDDSPAVGLDIIMKFAISMTLKAALELGIPDILFKADGGKPLTAEEILVHLPVKSRQPDSDLTRRLACLLKPLVWEGFFTESFNDNKQPVYGLTKVSKCFVKETKLNILPIAELMFREELAGASGRMKYSILDDDVNPLEEQVGMPAYEYIGKNPEFGTALQSGMVGFSTIVQMHSVINSLQRSGVLEGVETVVDVGGGTGSCVADIIAKNPQIKGINFDLPGVIAQAPEVEGMTNIAGNMFESVPSGDIMCLKWIVHNYDDKDAIEILKNCFKALPKQGKAIILECVLDDSDRSLKAKTALWFDFCMLLAMKGARERTKPAYEKIIAAAGFARSDFIQDSGHLGIIIAFKE